MGSPARKSSSKIGQATGSVQRSPQRVARDARRRRREEAQWAARSGPVEVRRLDDVPEQEEQ
jgi:hypothetical protein